MIRVGAFFVLIHLLVLACKAHSSDPNSPFRHLTTLDPLGQYQLEWNVDWSQRRVIFNVTVATTGYVGFGLARRAKMAGSDIVIGGVSADGKPYFTDRFAIGNQMPEIDKSQDWTLHNAWERNGQTFLSFSRPFDTCDPIQDIPITDRISLIWAYSESDDFTRYHYQNRGSFNVYLLDPDLSPDPSFFLETMGVGVQVFRIERRINLPPRDLFWCSYHKTPSLTKQHIIGFRTRVPSQRDRAFVHDLTLYRCRAPVGLDAQTLFEGAYLNGGGECHFPPNSNPLPQSYCSELIYAWHVGGTPIFLPDHVGIPMSPGNSEYFMLQEHYINPNSDLNVNNVTSSMEIYYSSKIRENDASVMQISKGPISSSIMIPPNSLNHAIQVHCAGDCTQRIIPAGGISVFAGMLHTHMQGRSVRLMQIRRGQGQTPQELPWVIADQNYRQTFQTWRILREERKILPGDQLIANCEYETTQRNGNATVAGLSPREEMCAVVLYYYVPSSPRSPSTFHICGSELRSVDYWNRLGVRNTTWNAQRQKMLISEPSLYRGMTLEEFGTTQVRWNIQTREQLQRDHLNLPEVTICPRDRIQAGFRTNLQPSSFQLPPTQQINNLISVTQATNTGARQLRRLSGIANVPQNGGIPLTLNQNTYDLRVQTDEFISMNPTDVPRWRRQPQCTSRRNDLRGPSTSTNSGVIATVSASGTGLGWSAPSGVII